MTASAVLLVACSSAAVPVEVDLIPSTTPAEVRALLEGSTRPVMVNVWASWCGPCRSEAPLLRSAAAEWGDRIRFVGIDVRDTQAGGRGFVAEYGLEAIEHYFDAAGAVPDDLGGFGVPISFFFAPGGRLLTMHSGVLDERTLAVALDEILLATP